MVAGISQVSGQCVRYRLWRPAGLLRAVRGAERLGCALLEWDGHLQIGSRVGYVRHVTRVCGGVRGPLLGVYLWRVRLVREGLGVGKGG